jgi:hypothetical protein
MAVEISRGFELHIVGKGERYTWPKSLKWSKEPPTFLKGGEYMGKKNKKKKNPSTHVDISVLTGLGALLLKGRGVVCRICEDPFREDESIGPELDGYATHGDCILRQYKALGVSIELHTIGRLPVMEIRNGAFKEWHALGKVKPERVKSFGKCAGCGKEITKPQKGVGLAMDGAWHDNCISKEVDQMTMMKVQVDEQREHVISLEEGNRTMQFTFKDNKMTGMVSNLPYNKSRDDWDFYSKAIVTMLLESRKFFTEKTEEIPF